jgi:hypothetical protein
MVSLTVPADAGGLRWRGRLGLAVLMSTNRFNTETIYHGPAT